MNTLMNEVAKYTIEQIYEELYQIKRELSWLDDSLALTKDQRQTFNDINARVKRLLGQ